MTVSCGKSGGGSSSEQSTQATTNTDDGLSPLTPGANSNVPALALSFQTNVDLLTAFTVDQEAKYNAAVAMVKKVVATEAFRTKVLNHTYNGANTFVDNRGRTNAQIYQTLLCAICHRVHCKNSWEKLSLN